MFCFLSSEGYPLYIIVRFQFEPETAVSVYILKSEVTRFSTSSFFHYLNPSGPLINRLKYFRIRFRFRQDIKMFKKLLGVHPTGESSSAVCITQRSQEMKSSPKTPRCASHRGVRLCSVHHTAESSSEVCITPPSQ